MSEETKEALLFDNEMSYLHGRKSKSDYENFKNRIKEA